MAYTNSSLATYTKISPNRSMPRNHEIDTITIHCLVAQWNAKTICDYFANSNVEASCNYGVGCDGSIGLCVEEKDRSWCTSSRSNDNRAITIEVASDMTHPYAVTDKALNALIELIADICKRNNIKELKWKADKSLIGQVDKQNMTVHRWFANKACPGDYLYNRHSYIAEQVNKKLGVSNIIGGAINNNVSVRNYLMNGDIGQEVKTMQEGLIKLGYYCGSTGADGYFGNDTDAALKSFQKDNGLVVDGKYGVQSVAKLALRLTKYTAPTAVNKIDTVKEVQNWANTNYKSGLVVDGIYGAVTKKALIKILQTELNKAYGINLVVDGIWGNNTKAACPTLNSGSNNVIVKVLQALLVCNGYPESYVDGYYGNGTCNSVKSYQSKKSLVVDGIAGKNTFAELCK